MEVFNNSLCVACGEEIEKGNENEQEKDLERSSGGKCWTGSYWSFGFSFPDSLALLHLWL